MAMIVVFLERDTAPSAVVVAVAAVTGETAIALIDRDRTELPDARIYVELELSEGRFGLQAMIAGHGVPTDVTRAELARRLAAQFGRPVVHSDCSPSGVTWLLFEPDGAVFHVVSDPQTNAMDLLDDETRLVFGAGEALPAKPQGAPEDVPREHAMMCGELNAAGKLCRVFWGPCGAYRKPAN